MGRPASGRPASGAPPPGGRRAAGTPQAARSSTRRAGSEATGCFAGLLQRRRHADAFARRYGAWALVCGASEVRLRARRVRRDASSRRERRACWDTARAMKRRAHHGCAEDRRVWVSGLRLKGVACVLPRWCPFQRTRTVVPPPAGCWHGSSGLGAATRAPLPCTRPSHTRSMALAERGHAARRALPRTVHSW